MDLPEAGNKRTLYLKETAAPEHYAGSDVIFPIDLETKETTAWNDNHTELIKTTIHIISYRDRNNDFVSAGVVVTLKASENWTGTFSDLPKYDTAGKEIEYRAVERADNYESSAETTKNDDGTFTTTVTNKPSEELISIPVEKEFEDGVTGEEITVVVKRDGEVVREQKLSDSNKWKYTFDKLEKYAADGHEYEYTVEETNKNYKPVVTLKDENDITKGVTITNYQSEEKVSVPVEKKWVGKEAESVEIKLLAGKEVVQTVRIDAEDGWKYTFTGLMKHDTSGKEIVYTVEETPINGYTPKVKGDAVKGYVITNISDEEKPRTGDRNGIALWSLTALIAGLAAITIMRKRMSDK